MPDEELLALAEQRKLSEPDDAAPAGRAHAQGPEGGGVHRELRRPVARPARHRLHRCRATSSIPNSTTCSRSSMVRETELFFDEVLKNDLSLTNFVASDFTMLNGRLAKHYGIPGVDGWEFRKVTLPPGSHRGGVLTMASVLKVTANGTTTSPVLRGAWVLDRILGTPPPQPPDGRRRHRAGHPRRHDDPRAAGQAPAGRLVRELPCQDRPAGLRPGELRRDRRLARPLPDQRQRQGGDRGRPADAVSARARRWTPPTCCRTASVSRTSTSSSNCC